MNSQEKKNDHKTKKNKSEQQTRYNFQVDNLLTIGLRIEGKKIYKTTQDNSNNITIFMYSQQRPQS